MTTPVESENGPGIPFGAESARNVLGAACTAANFDTEGARLLRIGENALYHLPRHDVVVRIARDASHWDDAVKEVRVSEWLTSLDYPAAKTVLSAQPLMVSGHPVTFWEYIKGRNGGPEDVATLGELLRRLHALPAPTNFELPDQSALDRVRSRIESAPVATEDRSFLLERFEQLSKDVTDLDYPLTPRATHGDAHVQNLIIHGSTATVIDFERFAWGQPEWDLAVTATEYLTAGWWSDGQYRSFVDAYGFDVMEWDGFEVLRSVHEMKMTTWLMQNVNESPKIAHEYRLRMSTLRERRALRQWQAF